MTKRLCWSTADLVLGGEWAGKCLFFLFKKMDVIWTSKILSASCSPDCSSSNGPPFWGGPAGPESQFQPAQTKSHPARVSRPAVVINFFFERSTGACYHLASMSSKKKGRKSVLHVEQLR
jgi:hypothetical protein